MKKIFIGTTLTLAILTGCEPKEIKVTSISIDPYLSSEHGKFLNICFDRTIKKNDKLYLKFEFISKSKLSSKFENKFYGENSNCFRKNVFHWSPDIRWKDNKYEKMRLFLKDELNKGNVKKLNIEVFDEDATKSLFKGSFQDL